MNKYNSNMEALSQQIKHNSRWRWPTLITVLGICGIVSVTELIRHINAIGNFGKRIIQATAEFFTGPYTQFFISFITLTVVLITATISAFACADIAIYRAKFFNRTAVKWGREWLLKNHDFRNDKKAHQLFRQMVIGYPLQEIIFAVLFFNGILYIAITLGNDNGFISLKTTFINLAISLGLAVLFKLIATGLHWFFQYSFKEYPQVFIDKFNNVSKLEPTRKHAVSSPVPLTVVWSILQMPPKRSEKKE